MDFVALVSGGKDSCFNIMECLKYGHKIIALGNLLPSDKSVDELDSYMYQTVGHQLVGAYAYCMNLPLYRRRIKGTARVTSMRYKSTEGDEVEDLEVLLRYIKKLHPSIKAVSSGAIMSNYQRIRVENVCSKLGLVSLAYLWMKPQKQLLSSMVNFGIEAILVKVAAMGLDPSKHLGKSLREMQPILSRLASLYGINECGEGGEYESLTLDCPLFTEGRIVLDEFEAVSESESSIVAYLHPVKFHVDPKNRSSQSEAADLAGIIVEVEDEPSNKATDSAASTTAGGLPLVDTSVLEFAITQSEGGIVSIGCRVAASRSSAVNSEVTVAWMLEQIRARLADLQLTWNHVLYVSLFLRDMAQFGAVNAEYVSQIREDDCPAGVPSRCTLQLPAGPTLAGPAMIDVLAVCDSSAKTVLHVKSVSCWAPSCIGPYSQCTKYGRLLFFAGQLGLQPATMALQPGGSGAEACREQAGRALLSILAVARSFLVESAASTLSLTVFVSDAVEAAGRAQIHSQLQRFFSGELSDIWCGEYPELCVGQDEHDSGSAGADPACLWVSLPALPKQAAVEIVPLMFADESGADSSAFTDSDEEDNSNVQWSGAVQRTHTSMDGPAVELCPWQIVEHSVLVQSQLLKCHVFAVPDAATMAEGSFLDGTVRGFFVDVVREAVCAVSEKLKEAVLNWVDVIVVKVYSVSGMVDLGLLQKILSEELGRECCSEGHKVEPIILPVTMVGFDMHFSAVLALEILAIRSK